MANKTLSASDGITESSGAVDPATGLNQIREFLGAKDDTSRFVGLALLKSVLDNQPMLREDIIQVTALWEAMSPKFLDRLLRAGQNQKVTREEARNMVDIAVAVLHMFMILLPTEVRDTKSLVGRSSALVNALVDSSPERSVRILQTLLTMVSQLKGATEFININDISPLMDIAPRHSMALDVLSLAWASASTEASEVPKVRDHINKVIPMLISNFNRTDAVTFVAFVGDTLPKLPSEALPKDPNWLQPLIAVLRRLITNRATQAGRSAYTHMAASLLQAYPYICPQLLFKEDTALTNDSKPFSYLFINLIMIDIRSSFPSLLSKLNSSEYPSISKRLSSAFDVLLMFIGFLIRSLDDETNSGLFNLSMSPDLLLKLRKNIAETMSLTVEYLRDRWDASVAGTAGLHPSAREEATVTSEGVRLTLTWESINENIRADTLVHASIRTLAIWLREDENENLRKESAGLADMLVELYQASTLSVLDFRHAVLSALEVILTTENGVDGFLAHDGWEVISQDLRAIINDGGTAKPTVKDDDMLRGLDIVRVLLVIVDSEFTTEPREFWMDIVKAAASMKPSTSEDLLTMEFQIAVLQLAAALLSSATKGMQKRYIVYATSVLGLVAQLQKEACKLQGQGLEEICDSLNDIAMTLENLR